LRLAEETDVETVRLSGFGLAEVEALCAAAGATDVDARELLRSSGGNPLFVNELLRAQRLEGGAAVPSAAVREVIARRLGRFPAETARVLEIAAVIGDRFEPALLRVCAGGPAPEVDAAIEKGCAAGLFHRGDDHGVSFTHALVREVAYARIAPARRAELHASVAEGLARQGAGDRRARAAALSHHAVRGASVRNAREAIALAVGAAEAALSQQAHAEAALHFGQALEAARFVEGFAASERARLLLRRADAERWAGERARAQATLFEVHDIGYETRDGGLVGAAAIGLGLVAYVDAVGTQHGVTLRLLENAVWEPIRSLVAIAEHREEDARQHYALAVEDPRLSAGTELQWHGTLHLLASLIAHFGDRASAARYYQILRPHASRHAVWGFPAVYAGPQALALGHLAATLGD
jgi:hypothetical protein